MATIVNSRDVLLQAASPRTLPVTLPSTVNTSGTHTGPSSGDHTGTLTGSGQINFQNGQITLSSTGQLLNAGGGNLTSLDFVGGNFSGDAAGTFGGTSLTGIRNGTVTFSSTGQLLNAGGGSLTSLNFVGGNFNGDAAGTFGGTSLGGIRNSSVSLGSTGSLFGAGGGTMTNGSGLSSLNGSAVSSGVVPATHIPSITSGMISVGSLSAITANLGTVNAGAITGSASISIAGSGVFNGSAGAGGGSYAVIGNNSLNATGGCYGRSASGWGVLGDSTGGGIGVYGRSGSVAMFCAGLFATTSTSQVFNLYASRAASADTVTGTVQNAVNAQNATNATNASNSNSLGGTAASGWCRQFVTNSGTASSSSFGFVFTSTVTGVRTRATGGRNFVVEEFSDENLKIDEQTEELGLDFINGLDVITYKRKDDPENITYHGVGARKTRAHLEKLKKRKDNDCLGRTLDDGTESTSTIALIAPLIKAVQELSDEVEHLKVKIEEYGII